MKTLRTIQLNCLALVAIACLVAGCKTPQQAAYITLSTIGQGADSAMSAAADATVAGVISAEDWQKIARIHAQFRASYKTACELAAFNYKQPATEELLRLQQLLLETIAQFTSKTP